MYIIDNEVLGVGSCIRKRNLTVDQKGETMFSGESIQSKRCVVVKRAQALGWGEVGFLYGRDVDVMLCNKVMKLLVFICNAVDV